MARAIEERLAADVFEDKLTADVHEQVNWPRSKKSSIPQLAADFWSKKSSIQTRWPHFLADGAIEELAATLDSRAHAAGRAWPCAAVPFEHIAFLTAQSGPQDNLADDAHEQVYWPKLKHNLSKIQ